MLLLELVDVDTRNDQSGNTDVVSDRESPKYMHGKCSSTYVIFLQRSVVPIPSVLFHHHDKTFISPSACSATANRRFKKSVLGKSLTGSTGHK